MNKKAWLVLAARHGGFEFVDYNAVHALVYLAWSLRFLGHTSPRLKAVHDMLTRKPESGNLVVEVSAICWPPDKRYQNAARVGIFDRVEDETVAHNDSSGETYQERAWYIVPLDGGTAVRWTNCEFMVLPRTSEEVSDFLDVMMERAT